MSRPERRWRALAGAAALLLCAGPVAAAGPAAPPEGWIVFSPEGGRFRIEIPAEPLPETGSRFTPVGPVEERKWWLVANEVELAVETHDVPTLGAALTSDDAILDRARDGVIASKGGSPLDSRALEVQGAPAREFRYAIPASATAPAREGLARTILVGRRVYLLTGTAAETPELHPAVLRFFASFRFWK